MSVLLSQFKLKPEAAERSSITGKADRKPQQGYVRSWQ